MKIANNIKLVVKSLQAKPLKSFQYTSTSFQIPQNVRSYENQMNKYLEYMNSAFEREQIPIVIDQGKYKLIKRSLEQQNEVSKDLDQIVIDDYNTNSSDKVETINEYYLISKKLWNQKEFNRSYCYIQRALQLAEVYRGTTHSEFYQCLDLLGQHLLLQGRVFESQFYFERALSSAIQDNGTSSENIVHYQKQLAYMLSLQGKLQIAVELYNEALAIQQKHNSLSCVETLDTILRINLIQQKLGANREQIKEDLKWILSQVKTSINDSKAQQFRLQVIFELALLNISEKNYLEGENLLQDYLRQQKIEDLYIEAKLNLGYIEMMRLNHEKSLEIYEDCKQRISDSQNRYQKIISQQQYVVSQSLN